MKRSQSLENITDMTDYGPQKKSIKHKFLNFDLFGQPVTFSIRGREKFDTYLGACCSILLILFMIALTLLVTARAITDDPIQEYQQLRLPGYFNVDEVIDFEESDIFFAVGLSRTTNF